MVSLDLNLIAAHLEGLEETIIHRLVDRAQFRANALAYEAGKSGFGTAGDESLFGLRLRYHEEMDAVFGRFVVPEERPFHRSLPPPSRSVSLPESPLRIADLDFVNLTTEIVDGYNDLIPRFCPNGDDGQYGSSVEHDVMAIQALGRRIHFGALYVAESKYRSMPGEYQKAIDSGDRDVLVQLLTRPEVEARILGRVREKVDYVQATLNTSVRTRVDPEIVMALYKEMIIPLTKEGEVRYLMARSG